MWTTSDFKRLQLHISNILMFNNFLSLLISLGPTGAARGFTIMSGAARGVKKVGQHLTIQLYSASHSAHTSCNPSESSLFIF